MMDPLRAWLYDLHDAVGHTTTLIATAIGDEPEEMAMRVKGFYQVSMRIDDEPVIVRIKCMTSVEIAEFEVKMKGFGYAFDGTTVQATSPVNETEFAAWLVDVISRYVTVPPGQIVVENEDGTETEIRTGAELIARFGGRVDLVPALIGYIWSEQRVPAAQKDRFRTHMTKSVERVTRFTIPDFPDEDVPATVTQPAPAPEPTTAVAGTLFADPPVAP